MSEPFTGEPSDAQPVAETNWAFRLLQFQHRLDAWDRLYNEEIGALRKELERLTADYTREYERLQQAGRTARQRRPGPLHGGAL
jgi:hypothetical protein